MVNNNLIYKKDVQRESYNLLYFTKKNPIIMTYILTSISAPYIND